MASRIDFRGGLVDEPQIRAAFIGCGSHSFRNLYPTFQFAPVRLVATCDLSLAKAEAFARQFGAERAYSDHRQMLGREPDLDAVFICTGYDQAGRPLYPNLASDCLAAGRHVWIEKPPAASCADIERMQQASRSAGRIVAVGLKKMFFPANRKAREMMLSADFGPVSLAVFQYPQYVPTAAEFEAYVVGRQKNHVVGFLDHLCHPVSLMIYLLGMPRTLHYQRSDSGAGAATFTFKSGAVASMAFTHGASRNGGMERTVIIGSGGRHIVVDNNIRVSLHRNPIIPSGQGYGSTPDYFAGPGELATAVWEPEFSLGQLYNKGLFLLGYYDEVNDFARSIIDRRPPTEGTLEQAWQVTRIFEAFAEGPGRTIELADQS